MFIKKKQRSLAKVFVYLKTRRKTKVWKNKKTKRINYSNKLCS